MLSFISSVMDRQESLYYPHSFWIKSASKLYNITASLILLMAEPSRHCAYFLAMFVLIFNGISNFIRFKIYFFVFIKSAPN